MSPLVFKIMKEQTTPAHGHEITVKIEASDRESVLYGDIERHLNQFANALLTRELEEVVVDGRYFYIAESLSFVPKNPSGLHAWVEWTFSAKELPNGKTRTLNEWVSEIHTYAKEKGWWDGEPRRAAEIHMLCVTELAEATEAVRGHKPPIYWDTPTGIVTNNDVSMSYNLSVGTELQKPEGEATELADCVIRIMDYFGKMGWDLERTIKMKHNYNTTRPRRHGGKAL